MARMQVWAVAMHQQPTTGAPDGAYGTDQKGLMVSYREVTQYFSLERHRHIGE